LVKYGRHAHDVTGNLIRANAELLRLETGIGGPLFQVPSLFQPCVTTTWLSQCWLNCVQRGIDITTDTIEILPKRERDKEIMRTLADGGYRATELATLNRCRMYLKVILLSDICDGSGERIESQFWSGTTPAQIYSYSWPKTVKPTPHEWDLWRRALQTSLNLGNQQRLPLTLGKWRQDRVGDVGWYTDTTGEQLFRRDLSGWFTYTPIPTRRRRRNFHEGPRPIAVEDLPQSWDKATVYHHGPVITVTGHSPLIGVDPMRTTDRHVLFWKTWDCDSWIEGSAQELRQSILQGRAVAVSDGSFHEAAGAAAWTIEGNTAMHGLRGEGRTPAGNEDHSTYRSELFGLWGMMYTLLRFTTDQNIQEGHVTLACDGLSALRKAQSQQLTEPNEAHYDLISAIRELRKLLPIQVSFEHVKGHQDDGQITVLPRLAWMNIEMDLCAKRKVTSTGSHALTNGIPHEGWTCSIEGKRIVKHLTMALRRHLNGAPILNHWSLKQRFANGSASDIDWEMTAKAIQALPRAKQRWVSKLATKFLPYGSNMTRWKLRTQAKCPRCSCSQEDKDHIFKCPAESAIHAWNKALEELDNWMKATRTLPQLRQDILDGLRGWHDEQPKCNRAPADPTAGSLQAQLGWGIALEGCLVKRWREEQDVFWKAIKSRKSSKRWTVALITRLIMTAWDMWQHRNKELHESDLNKQVILENTINSQIRQAYAIGKKNLPQMAWPLMKRPLQRLLQCPSAYKHQWMATLTAVRLQVHNLEVGTQMTNRVGVNRY